MSHSETIELAVEQFLAHKRALGRKYHTEEEELRLLVRYAADHAALRLDDLTPVLLDDFLRSRPRARPRSFNALLGVLARLLDWAVSQQLLASSPLRARRRRATSARIPFLFDPLQARRLLDAAGALADDAHAPHRGATYRTLFALCYGLGLRVGEACGLSLGDVDGERDLLVVRAGKFGKSRLVPHGPRIAALLEEQLERRHCDGAVIDAEPLFTFDGSRSVRTGTASKTFRQLVRTLELVVPDGVSPPRRHALRDRALVLFLYNTGARVQEAADVRVEHLDLSEHPTVRLHGKGDKWRTCPLWQQTARTLDQLLQSQPLPATPQTAVFTARGQPLTRYGIYKIVRRHASGLDDPRTGRRISPHTFRHTAAAHLLEAGVEVNVIRGWLGHADLTTTNRYAEINTKAKQQALLATEPPGVTAVHRTNPIWRSDETLLNWLASL